MVDRFRNSVTNHATSNVQYSRRFNAISLIAVLATMAAGCDIRPSGQGPGRREQVLALRPSQELEIGREAIREIRQKARIVSEGEGVDRVFRVSRRIAAAIEIKPLQREINLDVDDYRFEWEYVVVDEDQANAFCLPGGKIVVYTALLSLVENDDQLSTVLSHEIAHAIAHHTSERIARERTLGRGLLGLKYNREQESEADHIGIFLMTFAGYDPDEALKFWEEMMSLHRSGLHLPEFLSDHPNDLHRMEMIKKWIQNAKAGKAAFDAGHVVKP